MPSITLKRIPDDIYERLKASAKIHHRSLNSELISCLEMVLKPQRLSAAERLERIRKIRPAISPEAVEPDEISEAIEQGRP